jgi:hypothetical protein
MQAARYANDVKENLHEHNYGKRWHDDYYKDWGKGTVVTFSHGWPLSSDAWDSQMHILDVRHDKSSST